MEDSLGRAMATPIHEARSRSPVRLRPAVLTTGPGRRREISEAWLVVDIGANVVGEKAV